MKNLLLFCAVFALASCKPSTTTDTYGYSSSSINASSSAPSLPSSSSPSSMTNDSGDITLLSGTHTVVLKTSLGDITVELDADVAPKTVTNFVTHAENGYYDNLTFHRVIPGFMIQGGDPEGSGRGGASIFGARFEDEIDASSALYKKGYVKGVVAMANAGPDTNGSQFFIMEADYPLPPSYTIFGHVTAGQDVVTRIANVPRNAADKPDTPVTFTPEVQN